MPDPAEYLEAFLRNCPSARLDRDEKAELMRLFLVAIKHAEAMAKRPQNA